MELSFGGFQIAVLIGFLLITASLGAIFTGVAMQSRRNVDFAEVTDTGYRLRRAWLLFLILFLGTGLVLSLAFMPYGEGAGPTRKVEISGYQFNWTVTPDTVKAGTRVRFEVTSNDVNHGVGIYDPDGELIGNVQAMPDYTNILELDMDKPGTYELACLEYCGLNHHRMIRKFEVTP